MLSASDGDPSSVPFGIKIDNKCPILEDYQPTDLNRDLELLLTDLLVLYYANLI